MNKILFTVVCSTFLLSGVQESFAMQDDPQTPPRPLGIKTPPKPSKKRGRENVQRSVNQNVMVNEEEETIILRGRARRKLEFEGDPKI